MGWRGRLEGWVERVGWRGGLEGWVGKVLLEKLCWKVGLERLEELEELGE